MAFAKKLNLENLVDDLRSEDIRLNNAIDQKTMELKAALAALNASAEIEAAAHETVRVRADRYRKRVQSELGIRDLQNLNLLDVQPFDARMGLTSMPLDFALIADGFHFLLDSNPAAIDQIKALIPSGGITEAEREQLVIKLEAEIFALETELDDLYDAMEKSGFTATRRPTLSPRVFTKFIDVTDWNKPKLEKQRQRVSETRASQRALSDERRGLIQERVKLEHFLSDDKSGTSNGLKRDIERMKTEEASLNERIKGVEQQYQRDAKLFQCCIEFLKNKGVKVDHHIH